MKRASRVVGWFLAGLGLALVPQIASAFSIADHFEITTAALAEYHRCRPGALTFLEERGVLEANIAEDLNPIRKGLLYSHYYSPYRKLDLRRLTSLSAVRDDERSLLWSLRLPEILRPLFELPEIALGHLLHHLQDSASPPHVIAVRHGLSDSFENYPVRVAPDRAPDCAALTDAAAALPYPQALVESARATWSSVETQLEIRIGGSETRASWAQAFWTPSQQQGFGSYGWAGNQFGVPRFTRSGHAIAISPAAYETFKQARLRQAVELSVRSIHRYVRLRDRAR